MTLRLRVLILTAGLALSALPSLAQGARLNFERFPTLSPRVGRGPGLDPALMLTPDQVARIQAARHEIMETEPVLAALKFGREESDQARAARETLDAAVAKFQAQVEGVLSADQKALVQRVTVATGEVQKAVQEEFRPRLAGISRDDQAATQKLYTEAQQKMDVELAKRLEAILTPDQKSAVEKANAAARADAERAASARRNPR